MMPLVPRAQIVSARKTPYPSQGRSLRYGRLTEKGHGRKGGSASRSSHLRLSAGSSTRALGDCARPQERRQRTLRKVWMADLV